MVVGVRCPTTSVKVASEAKELESLNTTGLFSFLKDD